MNGRCERFIGTVRWVRLDKFIIFGKQHLDYYQVDDFGEYYNRHRIHMEREKLPPTRVLPEEVPKLTLDQIEEKSYVGGLVKPF